MVEVIIGEKLPINSVTIFAHYPEEYAYLTKLTLELGELYGDNNGPRVRLKDAIKVKTNRIEYLRIRKPDPYRIQVGCNDFMVENYDNFKTTHLNLKMENLRLINRTDYEMIEFAHPDFDVLAYVVSR